MDVELDYPRAIVGAFIFNKRGQVLLVKSPKWKKNYWIVPGGHVEYGESISNAVKREVFEETRLKVRFKKVFAVFESIFSKDLMKKRHFVYLECFCKATSQKVVLDGQELKSFTWALPKEALKFALESNVRKSLKILAREING